MCINVQCSKEEFRKCTLVYMETEHFSGTVRRWLQGDWFPSELRQMSPETPAQPQSPPLLHCLTASLGLGGRNPDPK